MITSEEFCTSAPTRASLRCRLRPSVSAALSRASATCAPRVLQPVRHVRRQGRRAGHDQPPVDGGLRGQGHDDGIERCDRDGLRRRLTGRRSPPRCRLPPAPAPGRVPHRPRRAGCAHGRARLSAPWPRGAGWSDGVPPVRAGRPHPAGWTPAPACGPAPGRTAPPKPPPPRGRRTPRSATGCWRSGWRARSGSQPPAAGAASRSARRAVTGARADSSRIEGCSAAAPHRR